MENHLEEIILALYEEKVDFIIAGGVAAVLHGVERMTVDLDVSVDRSTENLQKFLKVMKKLNMVPRAPVKAEILLDDAALAKIVKEKHALVFTFIDINNPYKQVDVFITDDMSYSTLINATEQTMLQNTAVKLLSVNKLIEMKQKIEPKRSKDQWDIEELKKITERRKKS